MEKVYVKPEVEYVEFKAEEIMSGLNTPSQDVWDDPSGGEEFE